METTHTRTADANTKNTKTKKKTQEWGGFSDIPLQSAVTVAHDCAAVWCLRGWHTGTPGYVLSGAGTEGRKHTH